MQLLVQPDEGVAPVIRQMRRAARSIDTTIFRFDLSEVEQALQAAVTRGVAVSALVAHTNRGGEKLLRKLELRLLDHGIILARSDDDLVRYHGKILIVDRALLTVMLFNYTRIDTTKSRSFAVTTRNPKLVQEAAKLFDADRTRQPYTPSHDDFVVSPENSRPLLARFLAEAKDQILIYDPRLTDRAMTRLLESKAAEGLDVRVIGSVGKRPARLPVKKLAGLRLHARVIIRDGRHAFLGSQSLRQLELDARREVGVIVRDPRSVKRLVSTFEDDWKLPERR